MPASSSARPGPIGAVLWFAGLAVLLTWPLASSMATHIPGEAAGDNILFYWNFWWMREALGSGASFLHTDRLFAPVGLDLVQHTHTALPALVGATVLGGLPVAVALNVTVIGSVALNGLCAWALAVHVAGHRVAGLLAGTLFAAAPYFAGHLLGHFNLMAAWVLPLFLLAALRATSRPSLTRGVAAGGVLVLAAWTDYYYLAYLLVLLVLVAAWRLTHVDMTRRPPRAGRDRVAMTAAVLGLAAASGALWIGMTGGGAFAVAGMHVSATSPRNLLTAGWVFAIVWGWRRIRPRLHARLAPAAEVMATVRMAAMMLVTMAVGAAPLAVAAWSLWRAGDYTSQPYTWLSAPPGIDLISLVGGNPFHPIAGDVSAALYARAGVDAIEQTAWLGVVPLGLLVVLVRSGQRLRGAGIWVLIGSVFFLWALGPRLTVFGADTGLILPATLGRFVPLLANVRIPGRAIVVVYLALAMLLALWWTARPRRAGAAALVLAVLVADFLPAPVPLYRLPPASVYAALADQPPGAVLELPLGIRDGFGALGRQAPETMYFQSVHGRAITGGAAARVPESVREAYRQSSVLGPLLALSNGDGAARAGASATGPVPVAADFERLGIGYVVLDAGAASPALVAHVRELPALRLIASADRLELYRVDGGQTGGW